MENLKDSSVDILMELLIEALPYVEEGEEFSKSKSRKLSKRIREIIEEQAAA